VSAQSKSTELDFNPLAHKPINQMNDLEALATELANAGYHAQLHRQTEQWYCALWNNKLTGVPTGYGKTALEALQVADWDRQKLVEAGRVKRA